jgi:hypothetical protein
MSNKLKSHICFIASLVTSVAIPLIVTFNKYKIIKVFKQQSSGIKVSIIAAVITLILLVVFFKRIMKYLSKFEFSYIIYFAKGMLKLIPLVCLLILFVNIVKVIDDLVFVTGWIVGCNAITFFILDPLTAKYLLLHKKEVQKNIVKEALNGN